MKNRQGKSIQERLTEELQYINQIENAEHKKILAYKALGAVDIAVEFGLITYSEWEQYIKNIFQAA